MIYLYFFVLGALVGSFLNVVIFRLNAGQQFLLGRSKCPACSHQLGFKDLWPIISFIFLRGSCRYCQKKICWQYFIVETITGLAFTVGYLHYLSQAVDLTQAWKLFAAYLVLTGFLIIIFVYDFKYYLILDKVSLSCFILALIFGLWLNLNLLNLLLAAVLVGGFFLLQFIISGGRWIGGGDIRLGLVMGAILGWPQVLTALFIAYILGALMGLILILFKRKKWQSQLPFGTFLSLATWLVLLWGEPIVSWYWNLNLFNL